MDSTALQRQNKRIERLKAQGVSRSTVLVHEQNKEVLNALRPHLIEPSQSKKLKKIVDQMQEGKKPVNVAQVKHLSPFRYPGGKTWLVPEIRQIVKSLSSKPSNFIEPFAGGAITSLSIANESLATNVVMSEIDSDVSAVWRLIIDGSDFEVNQLKNLILNFDVNIDNVKQVLSSHTSSLVQSAFKTIIKNRMQRGGIMAAGAGLVKEGEAGKGLKSRWYPDTLAKRIDIIRQIETPLQFLEMDAFEVIDIYQNDERAMFFVDPPYTAGGKKAGSRLYSHNIIDHERLFRVMSNVAGSVVMTYDDADEVRDLAAQHRFRVEKVPMKNTHHAVVYELLILKP